MPICSRYLAMVRRATGYPLSVIIVFMASSLSGWSLSSWSIMSLRAAFTLRVDISSPVPVLTLSLKKWRRRNVPQRVWAYFMLLTRDTVDMSSPAFSATSFSIMGFRSASSPSWK